MAIINCPECGQPVSDQAEKCVHCGCELHKQEKKLCIECGNELHEGEAFCPKCGCPVGGREEPVNEMPEFTPVEPAKKKSHIVPVIILIVIALGVGYFMYSSYQEQQYYDNVNLAFEAHNDSVDAFNESKDLLLSVWTNAIWQKYDEKTDPYTCPDGYFVEDFNQALENLYKDEEFLKKIKLVNDSMVVLQMVRKDLKNPPKEYEEYNDLLIQYIDNDIKLDNLLINADGSLESISEDFNEILDEQKDLDLKMDTLS